MIRPINIKLNAAHPELPLCEAVTFTGSPSTVLVRGVPPNCGRWAITAVFVAATFPDGSTTTRAAVQSVNDVWVATLPATATSGRTANGLRILANGIDENGEAVTGYILGVADLAVASLAMTPAPEPGETSYQMLYFDEMPSVLHKGDVTKIDGILKLYNGTVWLPFTDPRYTLHPVSIGSTGAVSATLADLSVNEVIATANITSITFTFPPRQPGKARDFFVRLVIQGSTIPTLYFNEPDGGGAVAFDADDDAWADIEPGVNILMFTDTAE